MNDVVSGGEESKTDTRNMVRAQNDLYMVVPNDGAESNASGDNTLVALREGRLTIGELQRCAMNICRFLIHTPSFGRKIEWKQNYVEAKSIPAQESGVENREVVTHMDKKIHIIMENAEDAMFYVEEAGSYQVISSVFSLESSLAQMVCKIRLSGEELATIQTNGTGGRSVRQQLSQVRLEQGYYPLNLEFVKPGMVVQCIDFEKIAEN